MIRKIFSAVISTVILAVIFFAVPQSVSAEQFSYQAYVEGVGWMNDVGPGEVAGTTMQAKRMEALIIKYNGGIKYSAHVQNIGWQDWVYANEVAGTVGQGLRMEAIRIQMVGRTEQYYDVYYRAHVENIGWLGWAKNGEPAGTAGAALRMEAIQIQLVEKDSPFDRGDKPAFAQRVTNAPSV